MQLEHFWEIKAFYFRYSYWEGLTIKYNGLQALAKQGLFMLYK